VYIAKKKTTITETKRKQPNQTENLNSTKRSSAEVEGYSMCLKVMLTTGGKIVE